MIDLKEMQQLIYQNKVTQGFNTTDLNKEFCLLYGEITEAYEAFRKNEETVEEELADVAIYLLGISEMLGINLEEAIQAKIKKNTLRKYVEVDGYLKRIFDPE